MTQTKEISTKTVFNAIHYGGDDVKKNQEYLYIKKKWLWLWLLFDKDNICYEFHGFSRSVSSISFVPAVGTPVSRHAGQSVSCSMISRLAAAT